MMCNLVHKVTVPDMIDSHHSHVDEYGEISPEKVTKLKLDREQRAEVQKLQPEPPVIAELGTRENNE